MDLKDLVVGTKIHATDTGFGEKWGRITDLVNGDFEITWDRVEPGIHDPNPNYVGKPISYLTADLQRMLRRPEEVTFTTPKMATSQELADRVMKALEDAGLHPCQIGGDPAIINLHDAPPQTDGDDEHYLATVTLTVTP